MLMSSFIAPVNGLVGLGGKLQEVQGDLALLDDVLKYPVEQKLAAMDADHDESALEKLEGHLELRGVTFGYSRLDPPLLDDFNLTLKPGQRVALVGGSGSGKSTVAKLVAGPLRAVVGRDPVRRPAARPACRDRCCRRRWRWSIRTSACSKAASARTCRCGTGRSEDASIVQAAKDAAIHDVIAARVGGYDSPVEEGGPQLQRRTAAAHGDRAGAGRQSAHPGSRRSDQRARRQHRSDHRDSICGGAAAPA